MISDTKSPSKNTPTKKLNVENKLIWKLQDFHKNLDISSVRAPGQSASQNEIYKTISISATSNTFPDKAVQSESPNSIYETSPLFSAAVTPMSPYAVIPSSIEKDTRSWILTRGFNPKTFNCKPPNARFFVIKYYTEDAIYRSIKYGAWSSTEHGNRRLDKAFRENVDKGPIYLFFSVNSSGYFCGMAEMLTPVDYTTSCSFIPKVKWKGKINVKWIFVKDIPYGLLKHIRIVNNENKPITNSRDTQELYPEPGREMLNIFLKYRSETSIIDDSEFYDKRERDDVALVRSESPEILIANY
ncbi:YTH-domain-containing protein [Gigaspora margarita]|uniref:YTH-domain-containing protein n=1 Tax=Gigaspora margarita TaxID=4874 RepID=A0A8H3WZX5_GIGMA|nr:YTH-domain-containing protein [Gigaspora margarita]